MNRTATTAEAPRVDRLGFPLKPCGRCGGSGEHSFNRMHGSTCFGCSGTGWAYATKKVAVARADYAKAVKDARRPVVAALEPGQEFTRDLTYSGVAAEGAAWSRVASISPSPRVAGVTRIGVEGTPGYECYTTPRYFVVLEDGTVLDLPGNLVVGRRGVAVDVAPFLAQAGVAR